MEISWPDARGNIRRGQVPGALLPFVEAIGLDLTVALIISLGGSQIYIPREPDGGLLVRAIGHEGALKLNAVFGQDRIHVPTASRFAARALAAQGKSVAQTARDLHRTEATIRAYLKDDRSNSAGDRRPPSESRAP